MMKFLRCAVLALMLTPTVGAAQDLDAGADAFVPGATDLREWRSLAEQGDAVAQTNLGLIYANGWGVTRDHVEAVRWYRAAAEQGYASAQFNLGIMYSQGWGVTQDDAEAVRWYRAAAEQGNASAQIQPRQHVSPRLGRDAGQCGGGAVGSRRCRARRRQRAV